MPDWNGNERIDSLCNILRDGRVSLMVLIAGPSTAVRLNGRARLTAAPALCASLDRDSKNPRTVIVVATDEVCSQCTLALQQSELWTSGDQSQALPSAEQLLQDATEGAIDGKEYDRDRATRAHLGWW